MRHNRVYTGYAPVIGAPWLVAFAERSRFFEVFSSSNGSGTSKFRVELNELPRDEWPARLRQLVAEQVSLILRRTVDPDRPLPEYGLDSLGRTRAAHSDRDRDRNPVGTQERQRHGAGLSGSLV